MPPTITDRSALPGIALGYVCALLPFVGVVYGIVLATTPEDAPDPRDREARRHGPWIVLLSLIVAGIYAAVIVGSAS